MKNDYVASNCNSIPISLCHSLVRSVRYSSFCYLEPMKLFFGSVAIILFFTAFQHKPQTTAWIRINQLGYKPNGIKIAVWCAKEQLTIESLPAGRQGWQLTDAITGKTVYSGKFERPFGAYGPFTETYRLNFSAFN